MSANKETLWNYGKGGKMSEKQKFKFVNKQTTDEFLIEEDHANSGMPKEEIQEVLDKNKNDRKRKMKKYLIATFVMSVISVLLVLFGLFWQDDYSLMAIGDALWLAFGIEVAIGWFIFVYNLNIFSPIVYATKTLFNMFTGKKAKDDYYTYMKKIEDNPVPNFYFWIFFISSLFLLIPAVIIMIIVL